MPENNLYRISQNLNTSHPNQRIIFVSGNFNIIHPGHLRLLNFARTCGDFLVVGLFEDTEPGVIVPFELRRESLFSMTSVGQVVSIKVNQLSEFISLLKPHGVVKGKEHESNENPEREIVRSYGGHLIFSSGEAKFSSLDLIRNEIASPSTFTLLHDPKFLTSHGSSLNQLSIILDRFAGIEALVIGDLIIDEYIYCDPLGMSQEDPTIVVTPVESRRFTGGAGIVAGHVAGLGASSRFITVAGDDETSVIADQSLADFGIEATLIRDSSRPTTLKQRYRAGNKTLLRVSHLRSHDIGGEFVDAAFQVIYPLLQKTKIVIFSDFNYGCLPQTLVDLITKRCTELGILFVADSQASSQVGDVSRFKGCALICATEREVRMAVNDFRSGLQHVGTILLEKTQAKNLIIKLGAEGILVMSLSPKNITSQLKAMNLNPVDVAGAGDAFLSAAALTLTVGGSLFEAAYLGSVAASIQVSRVGNTPIDKASVSKHLFNHQTA